MRLESLVLAFSVVSGCPFEGDHSSDESSTPFSDAMDEVEILAKPYINPETSPNPAPETEPDPVQSHLDIFQEYVTTDNEDGLTCAMTFRSVGTPNEDACEDCLFAFEIHTKVIEDGLADNCWPGASDNVWLLREHEETEGDIMWGVKNVRLQFLQTLKTDDGDMHNVLQSVATVYEYQENSAAVDSWEETVILAHDDSDFGRAYIDANRIHWVLDDGATRVMASGIFAL